MCLRNIIQNYKVNLKNLFWYANIFCVYIYAMFCVDPQRFKKKLSISIFIILSEMRKFHTIALV